MIHCPKCGAANRRGSHFCNECGEPLPMHTALRCPMCGAMNPVGNAYCDKCSARLIPMAAPPSGESEQERAPIKGLSLPTIPLEEKKEQQVKDAAEEVRTEKRETGDWLTQLRASAVEGAEEPETIIEPIELVEIPDWLHDLGPIGVETKATPSEEVPLKEETLTIPSPAVTEVTERIQELAPAEVPDWLQRIAPPEAVPPAAEAAPEETIPTMPTLDMAEVPDWLQGIAPAETAPPAAEAEPPAAEAVPEAEIPTTPTPTLAEVPDWLQEIAPPEPAPAESVAPFPESVQEEVASPTPAEVPDWLTGIGAEPILPSPLPQLEIEVAEVEGLERAEVPGWLEALRPRPEVAEAAIEKEPLETEGLLEGLRGVIAPTPAIEVPAIRESAPSAETSEVSLARAQLLQSLLARPAEAPQAKVRRRDFTTSERIQRWLVAAVLIIAVGGILVPPTMGGNVPTLTQPVTSSGATRLYNTIQDVSASDTILVAFEYGPSEADELNLVADPILRHILDQGAHISIVSTRPEGKKLAEGLLSSIVASEVQQETQYTLLDYRPGDATGVSQLLTDAGTPPSTPPKLILLLTAQPGPLRWWVEQSQLQAQGGGDPTVIAGLSAALEPAASPYLDVKAGQLEGAINGLSGAAAYEKLRGSPGQATQQLNALAVGHVAIAGLMVLGAVFYALKGLHRREK